MGLLSCLGAYVAGILLAAAFPAASLFWLALPVPIATIALLLYRIRWTVALPLFFFGALGYSLFQLQVRPPVDGHHISRLLNDEAIIVTGEVRTVTRRATDGATVVLEASRLERQQQWSPATGGISLTVLTGTPDCRPGDIVCCSTRLRSPRLFGTPGEFNFPRQLAARGIHATGVVSATNELLLLRHAQGWHASVERMRLATGQAIDRVVPATEAPLVRALVTGDQGGLDPSIRNLLARGGVSHLFAISGQHLGLVAGALLLPGLFLWSRSELLLLYQPARRAIPLLLLPALAIFFFWTGGAVSTLRALLMYTGGVLLLLSARRSTPLNLLAAAALLVLLIAPAALFEPAFQLSFAAVAGMLLFLPTVLERLTGYPCWLRYTVALVLSSIAASLATLPLVVWHFHLLVPAGLLLNPIAIPLIGLLAVPIGLLGALLLPMAPQIATLCFQWSGWINALLLDLVQWTLTFPGLSGSWFYAPPLQLVALALVCTALLLPLQRQTLRWRFLLSAAALLLWVTPWPTQPAAVTIFSVGQGDAILVSTADGRQILVDGGGSSRSSFDPGKQLLAPALGRLGVTHLDAVLLSHAHPDHAFGLRHILEAFPVDSFWIAADHPFDQELADLVALRQIPLRRFEPGWTAVEGEQLLVFAPPPAASENDRSLVLYCGFARQGVLLTGDLEAAGVAALLHAPPPGPVSLLKLPHHGSRHSAPAFLLDGIKPSLAVVSVGKDNRFSFPHPETLAALKQRDIPLLRTDQDGSVRFVPTDEGWHVERWTNWDFH